MLFSYFSSKEKQMCFFKLEEEKWKEFKSNWNEINKIERGAIQIHQAIYLMDNRGHLQQYFSFTSQNKNVIKLLDSPKYGKQWTDVRIITPEDQNWILYGKPVLLQQGLWMGRILCPVFDQTLNRVFCLYSQDNGLTFNQSLFIEPNEDLDQESNTIGEDEQDEDWTLTGTHDPRIIECPEEKLLCFCRQTEQSGIFISSSYDFGETWDEVQKIPSLEHITKDGFDVINLKRKNGDLSNIILFIGVTQYGNVKQLKLFSTHSNTTEFEEKWMIEPEIHSIYGLQILQDEAGLIHILYAKSPTQLIHQYFEPSVLDIN
jgi:hypothetical protein